MTPFDERRDSYSDFFVDNEGNFVFTFAALGTYELNQELLNELTSIVEPGEEWQLENNGYVIESVGNYAEEYGNVPLKPIEKYDTFIEDTITTPDGQQMKWIKYYTKQWGGPVYFAWTEQYSDPNDIDILYEVNNGRVSQIDASAYKGSP